ncbi:MAG TPA: uracil-DNA glycosylase [Candidatus Paceibacterota bacterium]|nr:uracil-DNA glycosylase [Candidatus Paceibacterota bacterium]HRZ29339.1 uracil-DNA glycosylase [Candidatus Paceibacterota bacterium]
MEYTINDEKLRQIKDEVLLCKHCDLYKGRNGNEFYPVIGEGNHEANIMFVGEAPGLQEAKTGRPFCGRAGKILSELLMSINIKREDVYIANLLKCRPPDNRDPLPNEIQICTHFVERQIEIIKPKVICPLGRYSMKFLMEKFGLGEKVDGISKIHGQMFKSGTDFKEIVIIPFYHPAVVAYNPSMKKILLEDIKILEKFK